jgi:hypothetical protein
VLDTARKSIARPVADAASPEREAMSVVGARAPAPGNEGAHMGQGTRTTLFCMPLAFLVYPPTMSISVRATTPADRETSIRLLIAQLIEHDLSADPVGTGSGVDLAFIPYSPA